MHLKINHPTRWSGQRQLVTWRSTLSLTHSPSLIVHICLLAWMCCMCWMRMVDGRWTMVDSGWCWMLHVAWWILNQECKCAPLLPMDGMNCSDALHVDGDMSMSMSMWYSVLDACYYVLCIAWAASGSPSPASPVTVTVTVVVVEATSNIRCCCCWKEERERERERAIRSTYPSKVFAVCTSASKSKCHQFRFIDVHWMVKVLLLKLLHHSFNWKCHPLQVILACGS